ncbi:helix-turn-helix transcriptional regulator [Pseudoalteromonas luteoviolacea]|nr:helix-turn-helix transcriptional regulator [Pseudoalteromonas luteoviolacea]
MLEVQRNLRHTRKKNNLTQSQLGAKLNVDQATISNFENGKTIMTIAQLYEMYLLFGSDFCCPNISYFESEEMPEFNSELRHSLISSSHTLFFKNNGWLLEP